MFQTPPANHLSSDELRQRLLTWALNSGRYPLFKGSLEKLGPWFMLVDQACHATSVPHTQYTEAAILLIAGELADVMHERERMYLEKADEPYWSWALFKADMSKIVHEGDSQGGRMINYWLIAGGVGLLVAGGIICFPAVLSALGFTAGGVASGSIAALIQSVFYGGATTGLFSILQGLGATLALPALEMLIAGGLASGIGAAALGYAMKQINTRRPGLRLPERGS